MGVLVALVLVLAGLSQGILYPPEKDLLVVIATSPPALMYVEDAQGRRAGADPAAGLDEYGMGKIICEIPRTFAEDRNTGGGSGEDEPGPVTTWFVNIQDGDQEWYKVHLKGLTHGATEVIIRFEKVVGGTTHSSRELVTMAPDIDRVIKIGVARDSGVLTIEKDVSVENIQANVSYLCKNGIINSKGICRSLEAKLSAAARAIEGENREAAKGSITAFRNELRAQRGKTIPVAAVQFIDEDAKLLLKKIEQGKNGTGTLQKRWWWPLDWFGS